MEFRARDLILSNRHRRHRGRLGGCGGLRVSSVTCAIRDAWAQCHQPLGGGAMRAGASGSVVRLRRGAVAVALLVPAVGFVAGALRLPARAAAATSVTVGTNPV